MTVDGGMRVVWGGVAGVGVQCGGGLSWGQSSGDQGGPYVSGSVVNVRQEPVCGGDEMFGDIGGGGQGVAGIRVVWRVRSWAGGGMGGDHGGLQVFAP